MRKEEWRPPSLPPCLRASLTTSVPHAVQQDCNTDNKHCADSTPAHMRQCIAAYGCVHTFSRACTRERRADKNTETDTFGFPPLSVLHTSIHNLTIRVWVSLLLTLFLTLVSLDDNEERKQHEDKTMHTEGNHPMRTAGLPRAVALCVHHTCVRESARAGGGGEGANERGGGGEGGGEGGGGGGGGGRERTREGEGENERESERQMCTLHTKYTAGSGALANKRSVRHAHITLHTCLLARAHTHLLTYTHSCTH